MEQLSHSSNAPGGLSSLAMRLLALVAATAAMLVLLWTAILWYRYHTHIPWRDVYLIIKQVMPLFEPGFGPEDLASWFDLHYNAHRIFMLRALVALDMLWFAGQNHLLYAAGWFCLSGIVLGFALAIRAHAWQGRATAVFAAALVGYYLFSPSHLWNILNPVNVSWHLTMAGATGAFALLLFRQAPPGPAAWLGAFLLASIAAFSTFAGVIAWLLLPLLALYLRSSYLIPGSFVCAITTLLYCQGITSDASVLANWSGGPADAVARFQTQGQDALSGNTPWQVVRRAIAFLGWPLGREHALLAAILAWASLLPVGVALWHMTRRWWRHGQRPGHLLELVSITALFCLGIALATQFGRIIPQPVHVQGPSQERFQSVVLVYWACVSLLLLMASARLGARMRAAAALCLLGLAAMVTVPNGTYLEQEILSMEYAARLHSLGERENLRETVDKKLLAFRPERIFTLDSFLAAQQLSYEAPLSLPARQQGLPACELAEAPPASAMYEMPARESVALQYHGVAGLLAGEVLAASAPGRPVRFYPRHFGNYAPLQLLSADELVWETVVETTPGEGQELQVYLGLPTGFRPACGLPGLRR